MSTDGVFKNENSNRVTVVFGFGMSLRNDPDAALDPRTTLTKRKNEYELDYLFETNITGRPGTGHR
jgi:hypothetical protein